MHDHNSPHFWTNLKWLKKLFQDERNGPNPNQEKKKNLTQFGPIGGKHHQQKHPSEDQNCQVPKTKKKNEPIALEQRDQKQLKRHLSQKDEKK
jgi:hypothetical protein